MAIRQKQADFGFLADSLRCVFCRFSGMQILDRFADLPPVCEFYFFPFIVTLRQHALDIKKI